MRVLAAAEARAWLKARRGNRSHRCITVVWPSEPALRTCLVERLAALDGWAGGGIVLERPGLPREAEMQALCRLHSASGVASTPYDVQSGAIPGHLFEGSAEANQADVRSLLDRMLAGFLEGHLVTKSGRFWATVGCGVIEFRVADKGLAGRLREVLEDLKVRPA